MTTEVRLFLLSQEYDHEGDYSLDRDRRDLSLCG